ncbi:SMI1/KNR4 family protein [Saccharopolyspora indica]|uniref:SMI1/KNR4 family protein n=1 Tax=Saccharopolyspora indica TaxID=1229659 RepID=UPI0022EB57B1|nr:SMI1/KNR4 family protein [Saccharopolyspora indica]MDA3642833.1 SMI1/KNR4 family protein [Saccharopolyspora indica]
MRLEHTEKPVTDEEFDAFERFLERILPDAFKDHYRMNNGGWVPESSENSLGVHGFNPISRGTLPVERLVDDMELRHDGCVDEVPFCYDAGGNQFMLQLTDGRYGEVDLLLADGGEREPLDLTVAEFLRILDVDLS